MKRKCMKLWAVLLCVALLAPSMAGYAADSTGLEEGAALQETVAEDMEVTGDAEGDEDAGNTGDSGNAGDTGGAGETGETEDTGNIGDAGDAGEAGDTGSTGETGDIQKPEEVHYGWYQDADQYWFYYNASGKRVDGWICLGGVWYYLDGSNTEKPGVMASDCSMEVSGKTYFFDKSGAMLTNWVLRPEGWYYTDSSGAMLTGWQLVNGRWYYLDASNEEYPGLMVSDCSKAVDGKTYFFNKSGAMYTGWVLRPEGWYYTNGSGAMLTGWQLVSGRWYYLDGSNEEYPGLMVSDCKMQIGEHEYYFRQQGDMVSGWYLDGSDWYYFDPSGLIASGWRNVGGIWYYLDPENDNKMACGGWKKINGAWYYLKSSGAMATNWLQLGNGWYYFYTDGAMRTGWQYINGYWYYFYTLNDPHGGSEGLMAKNTSIDGWRLSSSGAMLTDAEMAMSLKAQTCSSNTGYLILVNRSACKVGIFTGSTGNWNLKYFWNCAPGKPSTPTVAGTFRVQSKGYYFDSGAARCYWYTQFYGNYLFHSVLYNKNGTLQDGRVGMQLSHGCVRLEIGNAKWIYDNIPIGTTVYIY